MSSLEQIFIDICDFFEKDFDEVCYFIMIINDFNRIL